MVARGLSFVGPRQVRVVDVELAPPADDEVLVRTLWSGVSSGTELLAYRGELDPGMVVDETIGALGGTFTYPFRYGYSCVGRVEGDESLVFAFHPHQDRFVARRADLVAVDGVEPRQATLFPLVETALQVALDAGPVLEEEVVVTGLGAVGILTALLLQRAGARVVGFEPLAWRRAVAAEVGVEAVAPQELGRRFRLVVECSGRPEALREALGGLLAHEGEVLVVSWYGTKEVALPLGADFHRKRLRIRSTQVSSIPAALRSQWPLARRRAVARELLAELPLAPLATHAFAFDAAADAFAAIDRGEPGLVHAALSYE